MAFHQFHAAGQLTFDGPFGNAELEGNLPLGHALEFSQDENFPTTLRQLGQSTGYNGHFFMITEQFIRVRPVIHDFQERQILNAFRAAGAFAADLVHHQVARDLKEECLG